MLSLTGARGDYRVDPDLRREGGQAEVLRAFAPSGRVVGIKLPRVGRAHGWFTREATLLRQLTQEDRPWVVPLLDEGVAPDGRPFIVLPWFEDALDEWLERRPPIQRVFQALTLACESVVRLHRAPVDLANVLVHRDVKPYNFLVADEGDTLTVVLADLGIAKEGRLAEVSTQTGVYTEYYAPPEQQLPLTLPPDPAMDVHGLAATVWFGICDRVPRSVFARQAAWKEEAAELRALAMMGSRRTPAEGVRFDALRRLPIEDYADFTLMEALRPQDELEFVQRLETALAGRVADAPALARVVGERLIPVLRRGLEPDHRRRLGEAQRLYAAVRQAWELVRAEVDAGVGPVRGVGPVVVGPGGGTLVPPAPALTFDAVVARQTEEPVGVPSAEARSGLVATGSLPTLGLDETGPAPPPVPGRIVAPVQSRADAPILTNDPLRTMDPFTEPERRSRVGWVAAAGVLAFVAVLGVGGIAAVAWGLWSAGDDAGVVDVPVEAGAAGQAGASGETPASEGGTSPASASGQTASGATSSAAPVGAVAKERSKTLEGAEPERTVAETKKDPPVVAPEVKVPDPKVAPSTSPGGPTTASPEAAPIAAAGIMVKRCSGSVEAGELQLDGATYVNGSATIPAGKHTFGVLGVKPDGTTGTWTRFTVNVEADGIRIRDTLRKVSGSRVTSILVDGNGKTYGSRDECP